MIRVALTLAALWVSAAPQVPTSAPNHIASGEQVSAVTLIKVSDLTAVVKVGAGPLQTVKVNDLIGVTKAVVTEIGAGRMVLDESVTGSDGKPNRARIVIQEGERGGTRYLHRSDAPRPTGTKPAVVIPVPAETPNPATKKPPRM